MPDIFCKECASKPGWSFDEEKTKMYSCQRCFQFKPCNDYSYRKPAVNQEPAPSPKELVKEQVNVHAEAKLPKANIPTTAPIPVYDVAPPKKEGADKRNDTDKLLDALQPNRPGIKLEIKK